MKNPFNKENQFYNNTTYLSLFALLGLSVFFGVRYIANNQSIENDSILMNKFLSGEKNYLKYLKNKDNVYGSIARFIEMIYFMQNNSQGIHREFTGNSQEIHRFLNMRDIMTVVAKLNRSDLFDQGWIMRRDTPWNQVINSCNFFLLETTPKETVKNNNALLIADDGIPQYKIVNLINSPKCT